MKWFVEADAQTEDGGGGRTGKEERETGKEICVHGSVGVCYCYDSSDTQTHCSSAPAIFYVNAA